MQYNNLIRVSPQKLKLTPQERVNQMIPPLLEWFSGNARVLPWRDNPKPYYVWVSEIMLQQTRVEAVKPYFNRFITTLPDIQSLAECPEELLLKLWEGLGYYNRARNLQKAAQVVMAEHGGGLPDDYEALLKLPGIGPYTAGAIASIAYGIPVPAVDGNVLRVMSRVLESYEDILKASVKRQIEELLNAHMPADAGNFNQAMMEIGAMVCLPNGEPKCDVCPLQPVCLANAKQVMMELPVKTKKKPRRVEEWTVLVIARRREPVSVALHKREEKGLLAGMYEFPNVPGKLEEQQVLEYLAAKGEQVRQLTQIEDAKHIFSHVEWHMRGYYAEVVPGREECLQEETQELEFISIEKIKEEIAIPSAFAAYSRYMEKLLG